MILKNKILIDKRSNIKELQFNHLKKDLQVEVAINHSIKIFKPMKYLFRIIMIKTIVYKKNLFGYIIAQ